MPDLFEEEVKRTDVSAPLEATKVLENFIKIANIRFEIRIDFSYQCSFCGGQHRLSRVPISAMFKTDQAYVQEAGFGKMLWNMLWKEFPQEMCNSYPNECRVSESSVLKRELKVSNLVDGANGRDYDYAVDITPLTGSSGWPLFNLTTGLWKKGVFHEDSLDSKHYIEYEREMLVRIPSRAHHS